jgi:hypothetical protein
MWKKTCRRGRGELPAFVVNSCISDSILSTRLSWIDGRSKPGVAEGPSAFELLYPEWQKAYRAALLELNPQKLAERVQTAETAIFNRLQEISQNSDSKAERQAIEDALATLRVLKGELLGFPDWEKK